MKCLITIVLAAFAASAYGQFTIGEGTVLAASSQSPITVTTSGNVTNNSNYNLGQSLFTLYLTGGNQQVQGDWSISSLQLISGADKFVSGNVTVRDKIFLGSGLLTVDPAAKLLYTGNNDNISQENNSYIVGALYQRGTSVRFYPIGTGSRYAPFTFLDQKISTEDVGVQAVEGTPPMSIPGGSSIVSIENYYWEMLVSNPAEINSRVQAISPVISDPALNPTVIQNDGLIAVNLSADPTGSNLVESKLPVTSQFVAVGVSRDLSVTIQNLITPFGSAGVNDRLHIIDLEAFEYNSVKLFDRYGVLIKQWENYPDGVSTDYFKQLSAGSYIVVVEFGDSSKTNLQTKSQMVTVLGTK